VKRQSSARDLNPIKGKVDRISNPSLSDLFEFESKFNSGACCPDPWEQPAKDYAHNPEEGKRCTGSLASTQLTLGLNANSLGRSTMVASEVHSRSGLLKDSFFKDLKKEKNFDFGGIPQGKCFISKPILSSALKKVESGFTLSLGSAFRGKNHFAGRETVGSPSPQLDCIKSHRVLRKEGSLLYPLLYQDSTQKKT
jgi:hypothetical protein